ncbi:uncharacterized protein G2W53_018123 [Senna tora]|uniref:ATP-dependent DNA helicase n=1 Tax=Senna tora TaxID=362788 RepID=A0A834TSG1_9FABA|nr:uncharacterized protein G2W53_018123 [Senna tora]
MSPAMVPKEIHLSPATSHVRLEIVHNGSPHSNKLSQEYVDIGLPTYECEHCGAIFWYEERVKKSRNTKKPKFSLCCLQGKVQLPKRRDPPKILEILLVNNDARSKQFKRRIIITYNNMFAFTSMGGRIDKSANDGKGPYVFQLHGQNMHLMGDLLLGVDETPRFLQLYIYNTDNEAFNRMRNARFVKDHPSLSFRDSLRLKLIKKRTTDARIYNLPTADEIAALIVGDFDPENVERDIIVEERSGTLQCIDELHPLYLPMQYPLMFPRGEDGYRHDVLFRFADFNSNKKEKTLAPRQFFAYILQDRPSQFNIFLRCGKLTQQFIVDGYTMIESQRLLYIRLHQKELRANSYVTLTQTLSREHKLTNEALIDSVICAEIPDQESNPKLYEAVKTFMIHGPCGLDRKSSPCMVKSRCSKHFPKKFTNRTSFDEDGYCKYRRRDSGHFIEKNGIKLDNRFVVPYNPTLLLRYQAHINVEFCNQSRSIKYLFKYVSKGHDKVTAALCNLESDASSAENSNEIKTYLVCRYISPCEAVWRIFGFDINFREPSIERLPFHLLDQHGVVFPDNAPIDSVVFNATVKQTKFLAWFEANKKYPKARFLTYSQFPIQFVYKPDFRQWFERKSGRLIGRLYYVAPGSDLHLDDEHIQEIALAEIENLLKINGRSLSNFPLMPMPNEDLMRNIENLLISEELNYDRNALKYEHTDLLSSLTGEQRSIYDTIMSVVNEERLVASSGIASQLILGGRTAHSRFAIPLNIDRISTCHIVQGSDLAEHMVHTKLIIWDEAPMAHRHCFEAIDRTLRDIMHSQNASLAKHPFGGKVVVLGGDFRQILLVIPRAA